MVDVESFLYPYNIEKLDEDIRKEYVKNFKTDNENLQFLQVGPKNYLTLERYEELSEQFYNLKLRATDVVVVSYPRSGTNVTEELVWFLLNDLDFEKGKKMQRLERTLFLDNEQAFDKERLEELKRPDGEGKKLFYTFDDFKYVPGPRVFKTHLPLSLLPPNLLTCGCKVIYLCRNPKEMLIPLYHFAKRFITHQFIGTFQKFVQLFKEDLLLYSPYWEHVEEAWECRDDPNFLFLFHANYKIDFRKTIEDVAKFIGKELTEEELDKLEQFLSIANFKKYLQNTGVDLLTEKGNENDEYMGKGTPAKFYYGDKEQEIDAWIKEKCDQLGITFPTAS